MSRDSRARAYAGSESASTYRSGCCAYLESVRQPTPPSADARLVPASFPLGPVDSHAKTLGQQIDPDTGLPMNLGPNAALRSLYYRVCKMLGDGILACFVFDGPKRPSFKRDQFVQGNYNSGMVKNLKEMLETLGMEWRVAAGEAEAELAAMEERGEIDAVLTVRRHSWSSGGFPLTLELVNRTTAIPCSLAVRR